MGYKALLLNFEPSRPTELGKKNLDRMRDTYGFDLIELKKSPTYRKLSRISFDLIGDHEWPNHVGIYCWPVQVANNFSIPLTFFSNHNPEFSILVRLDKNIVNCITKLTKALNI